MAVKYLRANNRYKPSIFDKILRVFRKKSPVVLEELDTRPGEPVPVGKKLAKIFGSFGGLALKILLVISLVGVTITLAYLDIPFKYLRHVSNNVLAPASLVVNTEFTKASVYLNSESLGQTPLQVKSIGAGEYTLTLKPEFKFVEPLSIPIKLIGHRTTVVRAQLGPSERTTSYIIVYSYPKEGVDLVVKTVYPGAHVFVDDNEVGVTPLILKQLNPGKHTIQLKRDGFRPIKVEIEKPKTDTVSIKAKMYEYVLNANK